MPIVRPPKPKKHRLRMRYVRNALRCPGSGGIPRNELHQVFQVVSNTPGKGVLMFRFCSYRQRILILTRNRYKCSYTLFVFVVLSSHLQYSGLQTCGRTSRGGSHRRRVTRDFSSTFLLRCLPCFLSREGFSRSFPSSTVKSIFVYPRINRSPLVRMHGHQPVWFANPACGQLAAQGNCQFPISVRAPEFGPARQVRPSCLVEVPN